MSILDPIKSIKTAFQFARFDRPKSPEAHGSWRLWFLLSYVARPMGWMTQNIITHTIHVWYICLRLMLMVNVEKYTIHGSYGTRHGHKKTCGRFKLFILVFESFKHIAEPVVTARFESICEREQMRLRERSRTTPWVCELLIDEVQMKRPRFFGNKCDPSFAYSQLKQEA